MKIEVGKFYKIRDGRKARIYAVDGCRDYPIHGAILCDGEWLHNTWLCDGEWLHNTWPEDGNFRLNKAGSRYDLISEWTDPAPRLIAWICFKPTDKNKYGDVRFGSWNYEQDLENWRRASWLDERPVEEGKA